MAGRSVNRQDRRFYRTNDRRWRALREIVLSEEPFCRVCLEHGNQQPSPSIIVDHIDGKAADLDDYRRENLQGLCRYHDGLKSIHEDGGFGGTRVKSAPAGCDENGVPLDPRHPFRVALQRAGKPPNSGSSGG